MDLVRLGSSQNRHTLRPPARSCMQFLQLTIRGARGCDSPVDSIWGCVNLVLANGNGAVRADPGEYNSQLHAPGPSWWREMLCCVPGCLCGVDEQKQWRGMHLVSYS
jgi:hypothetical protein